MPGSRRLRAGERFQKPGLGLRSDAGRGLQAAGERGLAQLAARSHVERAGQLQRPLRGQPEVAAEADDVGRELPLELGELGDRARLDQLAQLRLDARPDPAQLPDPPRAHEVRDRRRRAPDRLGGAPVRAGAVGVASASSRSPASVSSWSAMRALSTPGVLSRADTIASLLGRVARSFVVVIGLILVVLVFSSDEKDEPRRPAATTPTPTPGALAGVEQRIGRAGLGEHLDALQRIAGEHGGNRASGSAGERATADYVADRLRAAGYRVTVSEVSVPASRGPPRLTAGSRSYQARTLQFSAGGKVAGTVRAVGLGCRATAFTPLRRGDVAMIQRGTCSFRAKALAAQRAGAAAVLISDDEPVRGSLQRPGVRVPVLAVGANAGDLAGDSASPSMRRPRAPRA